MGIRMRTHTLRREIMILHNLGHGGGNTAGIHMAAGEKGSGIGRALRIVIATLVPGGGKQGIHITDRFIADP